jgi:hypothetical protein
LILVVFTDHWGLAVVIKKPGKVVGTTGDSGIQARGGEAKPQVLGIFVETGPRVLRGFSRKAVRDLTIAKVKSGVFVGIFEEKVNAVLAGAPICSDEVVEVWHGLIPFSG